MVPLFSFLIPAAFLLIADAVGWIDLSACFLPRILKWVSAAIVAWSLPLLLRTFFHLHIDERHLNFWKLFILGVLGCVLLSDLAKLIWHYYGPVQQGHRRCPHCCHLILKVMLECPECRKKI